MMTSYIVKDDCVYTIPAHGGCLGHLHMRMVCDVWRVGGSGRHVSECPTDRAFSVFCVVRARLTGRHWLTRADDDDDARWMRAWITIAVVAGIPRYEAPCAAAATMAAMAMS